MITIDEIIIKYGDLELQVGDLVKYKGKCMRVDFFNYSFCLIEQETNNLYAYLNELKPNTKLEKWVNK